MKTKIKPTKDSIIALMAVLTITSSGLCINSAVVSDRNEKEIKNLKATIVKEKSIIEGNGDIMQQNKLMYKKLDKSYKTIVEENNKLKDKNATLQKEVESFKKDLTTQLQDADGESPSHTSISRGDNSSSRKIDLVLTYYGDFASENGGYACIDAQGNKLVQGTVASNVYDFGTKFVINGEIYTVRDRGGNNFNSSNRLDVFVPRMKGESDAQYKNRILNYGVTRVKSKILS